MTRSEFIEKITEPYELRDFCYDNSIDEIEITDWDGVDEYVSENYGEWSEYYGWNDLREKLNCYSDKYGYDWYYYNDDDCEWYAIDSYDFRRLKERVLEIMDDCEGFEPEEPEDDESSSGWWAEVEAFMEDAEEFDLTEDECSFDDMLTAGLGCVRNIAVQKTSEEQPVADKILDLFF